jgi:hypothetical protein
MQAKSLFAVTVIMMFVDPLPLSLPKDTTS